MKGRMKLISSTGKERDEYMVRMDFNTAKRFQKVRYGKYFVFYESFEEWRYLDYNEIVWMYRRLEDSAEKLPRRRKSYEEALRQDEEGSNPVHSLMLVTGDGIRVGIPVDDEENAIAGLHMIGSHNKFIDIGYTKEKEEHYIRNQSSYSFSL